MPPKATSTSAIAQPRSRKKKDSDDADTPKANGCSWANGSKLRFLEKWIPKWRDTSDLGQEDVSTFYTYVTVLFIHKYGWDMPTEVDPPVEPEDPPKNVDTQGFLKAAEKGQPTEEVARRREIYHDLRDRLQRWYRYHGTKNLVKDRVNPMAKVLEDFADAQSNRPRRSAIHQFYLRTNKQCIKTIIDAELAEICAGLAPGAKAPSRVNVQNAVAKHLFKAELEESQKDIPDAAEEDFQERKRAWQMTKANVNKPMCAEDYHAELTAAGHWLNAFAEHISWRVGMNVSIFLAGPVGEEGGEIKVRSVHAGATKDVLPKIWPKFDRAAHETISNSMLKFAHSCFDEADCASRILSTDGASSSGLDTASASGSAGGLSARPTDGSSHEPTDDSFYEPDGSHPATATATPRTLDAPLSGSSLPSREHDNLPSTTAMPRTPDAPLRGLPLPSSREPATQPSATATSSDRGLPPRSLSLSPSHEPTTSSSASAAQSAPEPAPLRGLSLPSTAATASTVNWSLRGVSLPPAAAFLTHAANRGHAQSRSVTPSLPSPLRMVTFPEDGTLLHGASAQSGASSGSIPSSPATLVINSSAASSTSPSDMPLTSPYAPRLSLDKGSAPQALTTIHEHISSASRSPSSSIPPATSPIEQNIHAPITTSSSSAIARVSRLSPRTVSAPSPIVDVRLAGCPPDTTAIVQYLIGDRGWGARWQRCVAAYVEIERCSAFKTRGCFFKPTQCRPAVLAKWMKHARPLQDYSIDDVHAFSQSWWAWWRDNQPNRHPVNAQGSHTNKISDKIDWVELYVTGPTGLVLVLMLLAWWGVAVYDCDEAAQQDWLDAVEDVGFVLDRVLEAAQAARKRPLPPQVTSGRASKKPKV